LIKINNKIEYELSKIMPFLISFASNTSDDLHHIKYK